MYNETNRALDLSFPCIVAVIGCGGKTSLITQMAEGFLGKKVLISPTTKIFPAKVENADCRGAFNPTTGKLEALPEHELKDLVSNYDVVLLEADGSRSLPCKGWRADEPVIPRFCTHTIGIVTLNALNCLADSAYIHNLPQFLALTGLREGEAITLQALQAMVCAPGGMFKNSVGRRVLLVNQVESRSNAKIANGFLKTIKESYPSMFAKLMHGSIHRDTWWEVRLDG